MTKIIRSIDMEFDYIKFQNDIVAHCAALGLTMSDMDTLAGVGSGTCARLVNGAKNSKMDTWLSIANAMDIDVRTYFILKD